MSGRSMDRGHADENPGCLGQVGHHAGSSRLCWLSGEATLRKLPAEPSTIRSLRRLYLEEMCVDAGINIQLHTMVVGAVADEANQLVAVITESKSGRQVWTADRFIDCTGDGDLAAQAGCHRSRLRRRLFLPADVDDGADHRATSGRCQRIHSRDGVCCKSRFLEIHGRRGHQPVVQVAHVAASAQRYLLDHDKP